MHWVTDLYVRIQFILWVLVEFAADRYSLVYTFDDSPLYTGLLTDIAGSSVAYRSSYTVADRYSGIHSRWLATIPQLQSNILGNSVADRYSYTLSVNGIRVRTPGDRRLYPGIV